MRLFAAGESPERLAASQTVDGRTPPNSGEIMFARSDVALRLLAEAGELLATSLDLNTTLQHVARLTTPVLADFCLVMVTDRSGQPRNFAVAHDNPTIEAKLAAFYAQHTPAPANRSYLRAAIDTGTTTLATQIDPSHLEAVARGPDHLEMLRELNPTSVIAAPLRVRGQIGGLIALVATGSRTPYAEVDKALAEDLARRVSLTLENIELHREVSRRVIELTTVQEVARVINSTLSLDEIFHTVVSQVHAAFGYRLISLYLINACGDALALQSQIGYVACPPIIALSEGVIGRVVRTGEPAYVRDAATDPDFRRWSPDINQGIFVPLKTGDGVILGVFSVESTGDPNLTEHDFQLLRLLADQISIAVANARLFSDLRASEQRFRDVSNAAGEYIWEINAAGTYTFLSDRVTAILGYAPESMIGRSPFDFMPPEDVQPVQKLFDELIAPDQSFADLEHRSVTRDGRVIWQNVNGVPMFNARGERVGYRGAGLEITRRKNAEESLRRAALFDPLTQLPNRTLLNDRLQQAILEARRGARALTLMVLDIDRFKEVNDRFGHHVGDLLLSQVGARLARALRESDTVARLGGDEFAVLLPGADITASAVVARKVLAAFATPFHLDSPASGPLVVGASLGIAIYPDHGGSAEALLRRADSAMYTAKRGRLGYAVYAFDRDIAAHPTTNWEDELRAALEHHRLQITLDYQPIIDLKTGQVVRVEGQARWDHPERGIILPDQFVTLAEQAGLIDQLARHVLDTALAQLAIWRRDGFAFGVSINLGARNLHDPGLPRLISDRCRFHGILPSDLTLEITESAITITPAAIHWAIAELSGVGVRVAIDDFGTGPAATSALSTLNVDEIKIDRAFVQGMLHSESDADRVNAMIQLARRHNVTVAVEGLEDQPTWLRALDLDCDLAQGFYIAKAMSAVELKAWLHECDGVFGNLRSTTPEPPV